MLRRVILIVLVPLLLAACGSSAPTPTAGRTSPPSPASPGSAVPSGAPGTGDPATIGAAFIAALSRGDDAAAEGIEDATMRAAAPGPALGRLWAQFVAHYGAFQAIGTITTTTQAPYTIAAVATQFANSTVTLTVAISGARQVSGLHVAKVAPSSSSPGSSAASSSPAAYVNRAAFTETAVTVGSSPWALPGTLSLPNGSGSFPAVVLVQGSGPSDRDETFGPNKPFRDLAWGLASAGVAVLRYDKCTLVYGAQMATDTSITVREETMDDAIAAVALLRQAPGVDPARVFLVGHSLGAYLAPRIAGQVPGQLAGIAMLEAPSTPLVQLVLVQAEYLAGLEGSPSPSSDTQLAALRAQVALAESPGLSPSTPASELPLDTPASYWLDLRTYDPLSAAAALPVPMFFSQGGRDYQVPPPELPPWQTALAGHTNANFRTYPAMDHLLLDGSGPATPAEYSLPGHVDAQLVADLAAWIKSH
jgi:dienelactone hydrolase